MSAEVKEPEISDRFGLSPMQQGMLFHHVTEPHSGVDIEQLIVSLEERVDIARLRSAWEWVVARHDILRVRFDWGTGTPVQEVVREVAVPFVSEDLRGLTAPAQKALFEELLESDRLAGFDLARAPLLRFRLLQWRQGSFSLLWTFHHALLDGRSFPRLLGEAFEAYDELALDAIKSRPAGQPYRRYIEWLARQDFTTAEPFWREYLEGFSVPTPLVVDRRISAGHASRYGEQWHQLDAAASGRLRAFANNSGLTMNALVMGAWAILLHRYSGRDDILFGATRACRKSSIPGAEDTVGIFINTVPVRVRCQGEQSALSVFEQVRRTWRDIRPYEHTPLAQVRALSRVPPAHPLFETLVVFENYRLDTAMRLRGGAWATRQVELRELTSFPVTLAAYDGEELSFKIEYDRRRLDDAAIGRLLGHLSNILMSGVASPDLAVRHVPLMSRAEVAEFRASAQSRTAQIHDECLRADGGATLHGLFEAQAARHPEAIALTCGGESLTYAHLNAHANRLARHLVRTGVGSDTIVGLRLDRSNQLVVAILAILKAGGAYLPIDPSYPPGRLAFILEDAQAPILLTEAKLTADLPTTPSLVICMEDALASPAAAGEEANLPPSSGADHLAYVIYTSGTTGNPKGSLITHRNVARLFPATESWFQFDRSDVWTLFHSCAFDFSVWEIWGALLYGGRLVVVSFLVSRSPEAFYELLAQEKVTVLNQTPSAFRQLIEAEETCGRKELALRYVIFGGEALEMRSLEPWFQRHGDQSPRLINMYGITETTVHVTYRPLSKDDLDSGSVIGVPIPDLQVYILDDARQPVPVGVPGEMYVGGAGLARGYLRRPELTAERFVPDHLSGRAGSRLYKTGDLARFLPGFDIEYLGRIDHQVKIRGFRIELGEIESVLRGHPGVRDAVVLAREDAPGDKRLVAYVIGSEPLPDVGSLRAHLRKTLPEYMTPASFVFLSKLPLTNNGKVDRNALPAPPEQRPEIAAGYVAPRTAEEEKLAAIWSKVLRVDRVGVHDNFFELGGDSILSIQMIGLARCEGLSLTPRLLFANQSVAQLAAAAGSAEAQPVSEAAAGDVPLTPIQHWFFEQELEEAHYYNQAFLFALCEPMDVPLLGQTLKELSGRHDSLRLRYVREPGGWRQFYAGSEEPALSVTSLTDVPDSEIAAQIEEVSASLQSTLRIEDGPLWRAAYFRMGAGRSDRLLLVIHHLAVDGVSWRPLLDDLEGIYRGLKGTPTLGLAAPTSPFQSWARRLTALAGSEPMQSELPFWLSVTDPERTAGATPAFFPLQSAGNTEGSAATSKASLGVEETQLLLQRVPAAYNTQINDVLLTALARAWRLSTGSRRLFAAVEGHGRENLFENVDLSRTVGWFTSIFPVLLELPEGASEWQSGEALKSVKEQIRRIPRRGVGYGILRYLGRNERLRARPDPPVVFNYLGRFDEVLADSEMFRFAPEPTGRWHSPRQRRRYAIELNCWVRDGRFEATWTCAENLQTAESIIALSDAFLRALRDLIGHCASRPRGYTPSDFPLAALQQGALDRLVDGRRDIEDIYPLSPIQTLFLAANPNATEAAFDHWQCTLRGPLDTAAFERAWRETLGRHTILRSTIHSIESAGPVQVVHRDVKPRWTVEDWSELARPAREERWAQFLERDLSRPIALTETPAMRFALVRFAKEEWKFLWSLPALLLDGWSWPVVFRDASALYESFSKGTTARLAPVRPYRDYLAWLGQQGSAQAARFWRKELEGFREPTLLPGGAPHPDGAGARYRREEFGLSEAETRELQQTARSLRVTPNTLVQAAWALLLRRQSGREDVVFGAAFSGRPADLRGVESIAGPFVNAVPVRVAEEGATPLAGLLRGLHTHLFEIDPHQFMPLLDIQRLSGVPPRYRLFDSLVVFQNYTVDESARQFGADIGIADFSGPVHSQYPVMLLAEPGPALRLTLIYDRQKVAGATAARWAKDVGMVLGSMHSLLERRLDEIGDMLSTPSFARPGERTLRGESQNYAPPATQMEREIATVWEKMLGGERVGVEENFFDMGGHSLLLLEMHGELRAALGSEFPVVALFEHPTVRSLAAHLTKGRGSVEESGVRYRDMAQRQKDAMAKFRVRLKK